MENLALKLAKQMTPYDNWLKSVKQRIAVFLPVYSFITVADLLVKDYNLWVNKIFRIPFHFTCYFSPFPVNTVTLGELGLPSYLQKPVLQRSVIKITISSDKSLSCKEQHQHLCTRVSKRCETYLIIHRLGYSFCQGQGSNQATFWSECSHCPSPAQYLLIPKILTPCSCGSLGISTLKREAVFRMKCVGSYLV